ncbi:hypothetical protein TCAL_08999 [Tigriopus californicus]|uniref:CUB domain-containing protein n=1 Tax=Tigriopus californicus TaxID=6832 RepID=A0A553PRF9_TIGCA|nr:uncharacterized protein LOC131891505 [Tigriopus californicus]TRY80250.1 hypothetical protein TCAL_08999 [Tigriopus californicus]
MSSKYLCLLLSAGILLKPFSAEKRNDNSDPETNDRRGKQFSFFQVIQFPNEACNGTGTGSGTCYTGQECTTRNGASIGPCANGFGVCCAFSISCGGTSAENLTVFTDANIPTGMGDCTVRICPANDNICQLRLDFDRFQISGPSTITTSVTQIQNGQAGALGTENSEVSQCNMDRFEVSSGSGVRPPIICGLNTGQHVFVDADSVCNALSFQFGPTTTMRTFQIRVTQYACDSPNLAPSGCTQFFTNPSGTVQTFNFGNGHLADQNQVMCVRQTQNSCRICWTTAMAIDFDVSGSATSGIGGGVGPTLSGVTSCCAPNTAGNNLQGLDCLSLPLAENAAGTANARSRFCGRKAGLSSVAVINLTICSRSSPFRAVFRSNGFEVTDSVVTPVLATSESTNKDNGVKLIYFQDSVN